LFGIAGPGLQRDSATRHGTEHFSQGFRIPADALLQFYLASFIQHAVPTVRLRHFDFSFECSPELL
jgi:hypothetical protein